MLKLKLFYLEKTIEIKKNNQHLLNKLLQISKGQKCQLNQKNIKIERGALRSLNFISKK